MKETRDGHQAKAEGAKERRPHKHKTSDYPSPFYDGGGQVVVDLRGDGGGATTPIGTSRSFASTKSLLSSRSRGNGGGGGGGGGSGPSTKGSGKAGGCTPKRLFVVFGLVLLSLVALELLVSVALLTGPLLSALTSLTAVLDRYGGDPDGSAPEVKVALNLDTGANLTNLLSDPSSLASIGAQLLGGGGGGGGHGDGGKIEVAAVDDAGNDASDGAGPGTFRGWCEAAACMMGQGEGSSSPKNLASACKDLDAGLLSATNAKGQPVIPLPSTFCSALEELGKKGCLCDSQGLSEVSSDTKRLVQMAGVSASMCRLDQSAIKTGQC